MALVDSSVVEYLLAIIKEQHQWRLEDDCSSLEIQGSFDILKERMCTTLVNSGCTDYTLLGKIQNFSGEYL